MIRFGVCGSIDKMPIVKEQGYDYLEMSFSALTAMSEEEYREVLGMTAQYDMKVEAYNGFFPGDIMIVGENVDYDVIAAHAQKGMKRAAALGGKIAVIGSGRSRKVPEGFDFETAHDQFAKTLRICGEIAEKYGMTIVVEPLQTKETNLINTVAEGMEICQKVNHPAVKCLADFFHVFCSGETLDAIRDGGQMLAHLHIARANEDRCMPTEEDIPKVREWAAAVKANGYSGRLSLEGAYPGDYAQCLASTRKIVDIFNE